MPPPSAPDAFRAKLIESRVSLHPIERARLFRSLLPHASRDPQRVADLLFSFLSRERSRDSDDDHAIDLIGAAAKNGCREFVDALFERLVEGAAGLPDKAGNAIVKIAEIFLNMNAQKRYGAKNHPFSRVAAVRRDLLAGLGQAVDTGLENGVLFSNFEGYLEFLLSNPVVGGETDAQLTISSVFHYLEAAACWEFVDFIRETLLLSPLAPPSLIIHACRAMFNKNDEGSEKYYLAGLAKLVSMDHRAILPDILGMYTNFQEPEHPALAFLEIAAVCLVAYPGVEPKLADELACWLVSHLEQLPLGCGVAASLVLAFLVNQSAERGGVPDAKIAEADRMLGSDEDEDSLDELLESVTTFVGEHAKHFASPGMSLLKSDVLLFLQTLASPTPTTPTFTSPLFTPSLLLLSIETAPSASHIPALLHTLRNPRTPHSTMNSLRSISRLASPSAPFATSLAVRLALSLPSAALKLSLLRNSAEKHGRIWRVWMGEVKDWVRNRIRFRESQRGLGKTEVLRARSKETEDEEVVQVIWWVDRIPYRRRSRNCG